VVRVSDGPAVSHIPGSSEQVNPAAHRGWLK
jgi:hypothetical protein